MTCKCGSKRIVYVNAICSDLCLINIGGKEKDGYVPNDMGIGGGDYVEFKYCMDCGQIRGKFPRAISKLEKQAIKKIEPEIEIDTSILKE